CVSERDTAELIHWLLPSAAAERPSRLAAYFQVTCGRPVRIKCNQARSGPWATSTARTPPYTRTPASRRWDAPPAAMELGSATAYTTRATPARTNTSAHGAVRPACAQGSSVTTAVPPMAAEPAARNASTSACGPPGGRVAPCPTTLSAASNTTQPTGGFGLVAPRASALSSIAAPIASWRRGGTRALSAPCSSPRGSHVLTTHCLACAKPGAACSRSADTARAGSCAP